MHVIPHSGHMGITKTYAKLRNRYFWPKMSAETSEFVQQCHICLQANLGQQTKIPLQADPPLPTGPLEHLNLDLLRISTPSKGYNYILVIMCQFSKYLVAIRPLRNKSSKNLAVAFFQHYIQTGQPIFTIAYRDLIGLIIKNIQHPSNNNMKTIIQMKKNTEIVLFFIWEINDFQKISLSTERT